MTNSAISQLFSGEMISVLSNKENPEEPKLTTTDAFHRLQCHIATNTLFLMEGLKTSFEEAITKQSPTLNREAQYIRTSKINRLPYYLTIQFVRFFWKQDKQLKAKIIKPVEFPFNLDLHDLCTDDLKQKIAPRRKQIQDIEDKKVADATKLAKEPKGKEEVKETKIQKEPNLDPASFTNDTGMYELFALLTHKGRYADSGHYVAWVKEAENKWLKYDDDIVSVVDNEEIKKLSGKGGGDWHLAYMLLYRTKKVEDYEEVK